MSMGTDSVTGWLVILIFIATGLYSAAHLVARPQRGPALVGHGLHLVMSAAMVVMWSSWGARIPLIGYVTVFTASTFWYVGTALLPWNGSGVTGIRDTGHRHHGGILWYHAAMMASMVWMAVAMYSTIARRPTPGVAESSAAGRMAGMDMSHGSMGASGMTMAGTPAWIAVPCLILAMAGGLATAWLAAAALRAATDRRVPLRWTGPVVGGIAGALMAAGMAVSFYEMA